MTEAQETQALLVAIAEKERLLAVLDEQSTVLVRPWRWRNFFFYVVAALLWSFGTVVDAQVEEWRAEMTTTTLRAAVDEASEIPWRHLTGRGCEVWVSELGLAEIECAGTAVFTGFGVVDDAGNFRPWQPPCDARELRCGFVDRAPLKVVTALAPWENLPLDVEANSLRVRRTIRAHERDLWRCISDRTLRLTDELDLLFTIDPSGSVRHVVFESPDDDARRCVLGAVRVWTFPRLSGTAPILEGGPLIFAP